jgi:putative endonuclease
VVEHFVHTEGVVGSSPIPPTNCRSWLLYILESERTGRFYVGHTNDLDRRFYEHNHGQTKSTRSAATWKLVYVEEHQTKELAYAREREIRSWKSARTIRERLLNSVDPPGAPGGS